MPNDSKILLYHFRISGGEGRLPNTYEIPAESMDDSTQNYELYIGNRQVGSVPKAIVELWWAEEQESSEL